MDTRKITLGGKERELRYDYNDLEAIERFLGGRSVLDAVIGGDTTANTRHVLIWAGLKHKEPKRFSVRDVADMCGKHIGGGHDLMEIILEVRRAIGESGMCGFRFTFDDNGQMQRLMGKDDAPAEEAETEKATS